MSNILAPLFRYYPLARDAAGADVTHSPGKLLPGVDPASVRYSFKCITVHQPWATLITSGNKSIENRSWTCSWIGPLLIHAGVSEVRLKAFREENPEYRDVAWPRGAIIGICHMIGCKHVSKVYADPYREGPYCWLLSDRVAFAKPVPFKGAQGLFEVPADTAGLAEQIAQAETAMQRIRGQLR